MERTRAMPFFHRVNTITQPYSSRAVSWRGMASLGRVGAVSRIVLFCFWLLAAVSVSDAGAASPAGSARPGATGASVVSGGAARPAADDVVWGEMPAGARPVYIGIHGGTVPVSLLTAGDGSPMIAQVGLTGTDFLHFMRRGASQQAARADQTPPPPPATPPALDNAGQNQETAADPGKDEPDGKEEAGLPAPRIAFPPVDSATLFLAGRAGDGVPVIYATGKAFERLSLVPDNWAPFGLTEKPLSVEGEVKILTLPKRLPRRGRNATRRGQN